MAWIGLRKIIFYLWPAEAILGIDESRFCAWPYRLGRAARRGISRQAGRSSQWPPLKRPSLKCAACGNRKTRGAELKTRLYDGPHEFNATMQDDASDCLGRQSRGASLVDPRTTRRHELAAPPG